MVLHWKYKKKLILWIVYLDRFSFWKKMITLASHIRYAVDPKAVTSSVFCFSKETNKKSQRICTEIKVGKQHSYSSSWKNVINIDSSVMWEGLVSIKSTSGSWNKVKVKVFFRSIFDIILNLSNIYSLFHGTLAISCG